MTLLENSFAYFLPAATKAAKPRGRGWCRQGPRTAGITGCGKFPHLYDCPGIRKHAELASAASSNGRMFAVQSRSHHQAGLSGARF